MTEELVLVGNGEIYLSAATRDALLARFPDASTTDDSLPAGAGLPLGCRVIVLTEEELRLKALDAKLYQPARPSQRYDSPDRKMPIPRSIAGMHPRAMTREAIRRRRQMAKRAARAEGKVDA